MKVRATGWVVVACFAIAAAAVLGAVAVACGGDSASAAARPGADAPAAAEAAVSTSCGVHKSSKIVTEETIHITTTFGWGNLPSGSTSVSVPGTDCILVTFSAASGCLNQPGNSDDGCYVRVLDNGVPMRPTGGTDGVPFAGENPRSHAHSHQFIRRGSAGTHTIQVQWRTDGGGTTFVMDDRTLNVTILD